MAIKRLTDTEYNFLLTLDSLLWTASNANTAAQLKEMRDSETVAHYLDTRDRS